MFVTEDYYFKVTLASQFTQQYFHLHHMSSYDNNCIVHSWYLHVTPVINASLELVWFRYKF